MPGLSSASFPRPVTLRLAPALLLAAQRDRRHPVAFACLAGFCPGNVCCLGRLKSLQIDQDTTACSRQPQTSSAIRASGRRCFPTGEADAFFGRDPLPRTVRDLAAGKRLSPGHHSPLLRHAPKGSAPECLALSLSCSSSFDEVSFCCEIGAASLVDMCLHLGHLSFHEREPLSGDMPSRRLSARRLRVRRCLILLSNPVHCLDAYLNA